MAARNRQHNHDYPDDIFDDTRMTFGEHIEELRMRMIRGLLGLVVCLGIGFVLDTIGQATGNPNFGVGKPMLGVITDPVETQVRDFYYRRIEATGLKKLADMTGADPAEVARIQKKLKENDNSLTALTPEERKTLLVTPEEMPVILPTAPLAAALGIPKEQVTQAEVQLVAQVVPAKLTFLTNKGEGLLENKQYLSTLSAQEAFVVYFKVSIVCGLVLSSPWLLYQFWAFVGAGLYPHERRYVRLIFLPSLILFVVGVLLCQFVVLPGAVKALLKFNEWLGFDPDIRLNEWLGLALILPLVFGVSFQTPLVMIFFNRIGVYSAADYLGMWRYACFFLALFAAVITPTPDVITMGYLFIPMFGLYLVGIAVCHYFPGFDPNDAADTPADEVAV